MALCSGPGTGGNPPRRPLAKMLVAATAALGIASLGAWSPAGAAALTAHPAAAGSSVVSTAPLRAPAATSQKVTIAGFRYSPASLTVRVGTTVTWTNTDSAPHNVTSSGSGPLHSPTLNKGASYSYTFTKAGKYPYVCTFHDWMHGTVTVT